MINVIFFTSVLLCCLPLLHSATHGNISMPICPESFSCPGLAAFNYPFYNGTDNRCGLINVNCTSNNNETIGFGGRSYEIAGKSDSRPTVLIHNITFEKLMQDKKCEALMNNFTSPNPLLFSISITPFITLFKCSRNLSYATEMDAYFDQPNYNSYNRCKDHNFYYNYTISNAVVPNDLPRTCEVIRLPVKARWQIAPSDETNISSLISPYFSVSFMLTPSCNKCNKKGGHCHTNNGHFQCLDAKKEKPGRGLILILVLVGSALILMLCPVIFIIRRCYKNPFSYFSSKHKSTNLEDGSCFFGVFVFSYSELEDATKNFDPSHELGDGGFGAVYYGKLQDGREVAVKRLYDHNYKRVQQYMNEVDILTRLRHPNLVVLYGCTSRQSRELLLVYEYIPNGTVADHLHGEQNNPSVLKWPIRMKIAIETASALVYLHASEIIHRDVKTSNILLDLNFCVKVADFGLSRLIPNDVTHVSTAPQGTPGYVDPQYHQCYRLTDKSDVYSFGVVLIELISSMVAVDLTRSQDAISLANLALNMIKRSEIDQLIDPDLVTESDSETMNMMTSVAELAFRCLQFDPEMRPTMKEVFDVLMDIQGDERIEDDESIRDLKTIKLPPPSETKDVIALLKDFQPSPVSVTREWQSDSSASTTLCRSNGD